MGAADPFAVDPVRLWAPWFHPRKHPEQFPECRGGGYIAWVQRSVTPAARHQLAAGGPDDLIGLTISPSLWHRAKGAGNSPHHGCHGFIRDGVWIPT